MAHSARQLRLTEDLPIIVEVADSRERIEPFVRAAEGLLEQANTGGLITIEEITLIKPGQH